MVDTRVTLCGTELSNPIIPASGTFGFGYEFAGLYDILQPLCPDRVFQRADHLGFARAAVDGQSVHPQWHHQLDRRLETQRLAHRSASAREERRSVAMVRRSSIMSQEFIRG